MVDTWEGTVLSVQGETFTARLVSDSGAEGDEEILLSVVKEEDLSLVQPGAIFDWTLDDMRFRRLPVWTKQEIDQTRQDADRIFEAIGWDDE